MNINDLSESLKPILDLELELGNEIEGVYSPAGTKCPLAVVFKKRLHFDEIHKRLVVAPSVLEWEQRDAHYAPERGFQCTETRHCLAGPIKDPRNPMPYTTLKTNDTGRAGAEFLSDSLVPIFGLELQLGNEIIRVDSPANAKFPLTLVFREPLHFAEIHERLTLASSVREWKQGALNGSRMRGFICDETRNVLIGPPQQLWERLLNAVFQRSIAFLRKL